MTQARPPPSNSRITEIIKRIMHKIVPITATPLLIGFFLCAETPEIIPTTRKIIPIQFSQPNKGTKPIKTNTKPKIAKIRLAILFLLYMNIR